MESRLVSSRSVQNFILIPSSICLSYSSMISSKFIVFPTNVSTLVQELLLVTQSQIWVSHLIWFATNGLKCLRHVFGVFKSSYFLRNQFDFRSIWRIKYLANVKRLFRLSKVTKSRIKNWMLLKSIWGLHFRINEPNKSLREKS